MGFPGGSEGKASTCNARDTGSIPGLGRSPGEGNGNPIQNSCLGNSTDRGAWWATVHGVAKSQTWLSNTPTHITAPPFSFLQHSDSLTSMSHFLRRKNNHDHKSPITLVAAVEMLVYPELAPSSSCLFHHSAGPAVFTPRTATLAEEREGWLLLRDGCVDGLCWFVMVCSPSCYRCSPHSHIPWSLLGPKLYSTVLALFQAESKQICLAKTLPSALEPFLIPIPINKVL